VQIEIAHASGKRIQKSGENQEGYLVKKSESSQRKGTPGQREERYAM